MEATPKKRNALKQVLLGLLILGLGAGLLTWLVRSRSRAEAPRTDIVPAPTVTVVHPARATINRIVELPATVVGLQEAKLYAKVSGFLKAVYVDKGDSVHAGQLLATIESPELVREVEHERENYTAALANLRSSAAQLSRAQSDERTAQAEYHRSVARQTQARAEIARARAGLNLARVTYQRLKGVYDSDHGLIAKQDVDVAEASLLAEDAKLVAAQTGFQAATEEVAVQKSQVAAAANQVTSVRAQMNSVEAQSRATRESEKRAADLLSYTRIPAPFDGVITGRFLDPGPLVQSAQTNAQEATHPVLSMANYDVVRVYVQVPQPDMPFVVIGTPVDLTVDELPGRTFKGTVTRTTRSLDEVTRTMLVECDLPNRPHVLHPGMLAHDRLLLQSHPNALTVPAIAIGVDGQKRFVYVVNQNVARKVSVSVGFEEPLRVEITHGLQGNEAVVIAGKEGINDGTVVRIAPQKSQSAGYPQGSQG